MYYTCTAGLGGVGSGVVVELLCLYHVSHS